jgi:hypothetical protein
MINTQKQIRALFWATFPNLSRKTIPDHARGDVVPMTRTDGTRLTLAAYCSTPTKMRAPCGSAMRG